MELIIGLIRMFICNLMKFIILFCFIASLSSSSFAQKPNVVFGTIHRIDSFPSKYITHRNIDVWLPDGYSKEKKYAVLYMQDGQMLYDSALAWNHTSWDVDDVISKLNKNNSIKDLIVVGIWNDVKTRHAEYFPQKPFQRLTIEEQDFIYKAKRNNGLDVFNGCKINSDHYLKFIVKELKPFIDHKYATYTDRKNTFIAGSSMGGLISIYAICEYPKIFGGAACMSTHWPGIFTMDNNPIPNAFLFYLKSQLPNSINHRIYFDYGDQTLDSMYTPLQNKVDEVMMSKGFTVKNWLTKYFPGENHSEKAWNKRLGIPLLFLLKK